MAHAQKVRRRARKSEQQQERRNNIFGRVSEKLWAVFVKYLPAEPAAKRRARPVVPFRKVLGGILYRLRTGCQWKAIPAEFGSGSTCHRRFQEWQALDLFERVWADQPMTANAALPGTGKSWTAPLFPHRWAAIRPAKTRPIVPKWAASGTCWWTAAACRWP